MHISFRAQLSTSQEKIVQDPGGGPLPRRLPAQGGRSALLRTQVHSFSCIQLQPVEFDNERDDLTALHGFLNLEAKENRLILLEAYLNIFSNLSNFYYNTTVPPILFIWLLILLGVHYQKEHVIGHLIIHLCKYY